MQHLCSTANKKVKYQELMPDKYKEHPGLYLEILIS